MFTHISPRSKSIRLQKRTESNCVCTPSSLMLFHNRPRFTCGITPACRWKTWSRFVMLVKRDIVILGSGVLVEAEIHQRYIMFLCGKLSASSAVILRRTEIEITYLPGIIYRHSRCRESTAVCKVAHWKASEGKYTHVHMPHLLTCNEFSLDYLINKVYSKTAQAGLLKWPGKWKFSVLFPINDIILSLSEHIFLLKKHTLYVNARSDDYGILMKTTR